MEPNVPDLPRLDGRRLVLAGTGAVAAAHLPQFVMTLRAACPRAPVRVVVTRSALRFVTETAIRLTTGPDLMVDEWRDDGYEEAPHVALDRWADAFLVYPATLHLLSRLAHGLADTPLLLALQCTRAPVAVAPSLPPGGAGSAAYRQALALLKERPNVVVGDPVTGVSMTTGERFLGPPLPFPALLELLDRHLEETP